MNQSQMLLVLGAIVMFSFLTLNAHRTVMTAAQMRLDSEYIITAAEVAESVLNEVKSKSFDENTIFTDVDDENGFSYKLGPESGETSASYDDIDDFITDEQINPARSIITPRTGQFFAYISVVYVHPSFPNYTSSTPTRMKRIRVSVKSPMLKMPLTLNYYSSY